MRTNIISPLFFDVCKAILLLVFIFTQRSVNFAGHSMKKVIVRWSGHEISGILIIHWRLSMIIILLSPEEGSLALLLS